MPALFTKRKEWSHSRANPSVPVRVHKSVRETSRSTVSKCWHTGIQRNQHGNLMLYPLPGCLLHSLCASWLSSTGIYLKAEALYSATFAKDQWGKTEARQENCPFSSQSQGFLDMKDTTTHLTANYYIFTQNVLTTHLGNTIRTPLLGT